MTRVFPLACTALLVGCTALLVGCTAPTEPLEQERIGSVQAPITVEEAVTAGCSTSQIEGLSLQIICQGNINEPGAFSELSPTANVNFGSAVLPFLEEPARDKLAEALAENAGTNMQINSMFRTVAQQYLLYRWYLTGTCGVGLAASPGTSNHETGLAIDIQEYDTWRTILEAKDFAWLGSGDPVHFDYVGAGAIDHRGLDVLAFQQLWNLNNPTDLITEDGIYGNQTESRIQLSPSEGFPEGPTCGTPGVGMLSIDASFDDASDRFADGASVGVTDLVEGEEYVLTVVVSNTGAATVADVTLGATTTASLSVDADALPLGDIAAGASVEAQLLVTAETYSVVDAETEMIELTVPDATAELTADVYSQRRWEWDGERLEGWSPVAEVVGGALLIGAGTSATSPAITVAADTVAAIRALGSSESAGTVIVNSDAGEHVFNLDLTGGEALFAIEGVSGDITGLRIDATTEMSLDALRLETEAEVPPGPTVDGGCGCQLPGGSRTSHRWLLLLALSLMGARLRGWASRPSP